MSHWMKDPKNKEKLKERSRKAAATRRANEERKRKEAYAEGKDPPKRKYTKTSPKWKQNGGITSDQPLQSLGDPDQGRARLASLVAENDLLTTENETLRQKCTTLCDVVQRLTIGMT